MNILLSLKIFISLIFLRNVKAIGSCKKIKDCFNCTLSPNCLWGFGCEETPGIYGVTFDQIFQKCFEDEESFRIIEKYCGDLILQPKDEEFSLLPQVKGSYGFPNLICKYTLKMEDLKKNVEFMIKGEEKYKEFLQVLINATFRDGSTSTAKIEGVNYNITVPEPVEVSIIVYTEQMVDSNPLSLRIKFINKEISAVLITIITLVTIAVLALFGVLFFLCIRFKRKRNFEPVIQIFDFYRFFQLNQTTNPLNQEEALKEKRKLQIEEALEKDLQPQKYNSNLGKSSTTCSICLEDFNDDSIVCVTKCGHVFHFCCIQTWLHENILEPKCPNCKTSLLPDIQTKEQVQERIIRFVPGTSRNVRQRLEREISPLYIYQRRRTQNRLSQREMNSENRNLTIRVNPM